MQQFPGFKGPLDQEGRCVRRLRFTDAKHKGNGALGIVLRIAPRQQGRGPFFGWESLRKSDFIVFLPSRLEIAHTRSRQLPGTHQQYLHRPEQTTWPPSCMLHFRRKAERESTSHADVSPNSALPSALFAATDQRRRRCTKVITSTRRNGWSVLLPMVALISA